MWYNAFVENIVLPVADALNGTRYIASLKSWRRIQKLSESELQVLEEKKLTELLNHAVQNIPFYRKYNRTGAGVLSLKDFPLMTKAIIRENMNQLLWHPEEKQGLICEKSSGSSGVQGQIYMSRREQSNVQALQTLLWEWSGYTPGSIILQTGMTLKRGLVKTIKDILFRTNYQSAFGLAEHEVLKVLKELKRDNSFFGGYASSLFVFAQVAAKNDIGDIQFQSVISWGDKMFPHYRNLIERQFSTKVFDTYGTTEGFMIAGQKDLEYYYIISPHVHVEIMNEHGEEVPDGEMGYVVVTSLDAYEMPLIRYYLGDLAVKLPRSKYPPQRSLNFPMLQSIIGRDTDIVKTPSGKSMIVHFFTAIFEHIPEIKQFRIVQHELSGMTVEYIEDKNFEPVILETIQAKIQGYLKEAFPVKFIRVTEIPASPSGKPQIIVSHLV